MTETAQCCSVVVGRHDIARFRVATMSRRHHMCAVVNTTALVTAGSAALPDDAFLRDHIVDPALRTSPVKRIALVGCPGAGKTTLARKLGRALELPVIHLDSHYWRSGWERIRQPEWEKKIEALTREPNWIAEGIFRAWPAPIIARSECIIFLDVRRTRCFRRALRRMIEGRQREELAAACRDKFDLRLLRHIWTYHRTERAEICDFAMRHLDRIHFLRFEDVNEALQWFARH
jgi:adenylate kinase family enzyme